MHLENIELNVIKSLNDVRNRNVGSTQKIILIINVKSECGRL